LQIQPAPFLSHLSILSRINLYHEVMVAKV
jgi:hypothetical protein